MDEAADDAAGGKGQAHTMKLVAKCSACPARFSAKAPDADAHRIRRLAATFAENHERDESDSHRVKVTETPPRIAAN